jgi:hypothetical protein
MFAILVLLFHQRPAEFVNPVQTLLDVRHAGRVAQADVIVRAESDARHGGCVSVAYLGFIEGI